MLVEFNEEFGVSVDEVYEYFRTPMHWPGLFPAFGEARDLGDGRYAVPFRQFPFPLVTRVTRNEPLECVEWTFEGFWRGDAQVILEPTSRGVLIRGYERIAPRGLFLFAPLVERLFLEKRFRAVWESGWRRLRRQGATRSKDSSSKSE